MQKKTRVITAVVCAFTAACLCLGACPSMKSDIMQPQTAYAAPETPSNQKGPTAVKKPSAKQRKKFRQASDSFSINLFKRCVRAKGSNANVTIAPMSVLNTMAMAANGSAGTTRKQMRAILAGGKSVGTLDRNLRWFNSQLTNSPKARALNANSIWYDTGDSLKIKKSFIKKNEKYLSAQTKPVDFSDPGTVGEINSWVSANTEKMIKKVIERLDPEDELVLVNAEYFDAKWKTPFEKARTVKQRFTNAKGKSRKVEMMHGTEHSYIEGDGVRGFIKPYAKGYSFVALLPSKGITAKKFVSKMKGSTLSKLINRAEDVKVITAMPKLDLSHQNDKMEKQLAAMGMKAAFNPSKANFKNMGSSPMGPLYIDQVIHKTRIRVDEQGTKAAAVTAAIAEYNSWLVGERTEEVTLNRPFVYAIIDNRTKLPLFIGTVNNVK